MADKLRSLGLCLGASTVSIVQLELDRSEQKNPSAKQKPRLIDFSLYPHEGNPKKTLLDAFSRLDLGII